MGCRLVGAAIGLGALGLAGTALANGKFPASEQLVVDPGDPQHIVVQTTFGILVSRDGGAHFDWICEAGAGYGGSYNPPIAVTSAGAAIAGLLDGLSMGRADGCDWQLAGGELAGALVADVSALPGVPGGAIALRVGPAGSTVFTTVDDGVHWAPVGTSTPAAFQGETLDAAPSDPMRIYLSGTRQDDGGIRGAIARSSDGGATWEIVDLPADAGPGVPYLAAIDPVDPLVVYVRTASTPGHLLASADGGQTWVTALTTAGPLKAFALSPDGSTILAGGPADGLFRAPASTLAFAKVSSVAATCLAWSEADVYACGGAFAVGTSADQGDTFTPLLRLECVRGPLACDASTTVGAVCPAAWSATAVKLGTQYCGADAGSPGASASSSAGTGGVAASSGGGASGGDGGGGAGGGEAGCACEAGGDGDGRWSAIAIAMIASSVLRRARSRAR